MKVFARSKTVVHFIDSRRICYLKGQCIMISSTRKQKTSAYFAFTQNLSITFVLPYLIQNTWLASAPQTLYSMLMR